mmetsp:Transcript_15835/g.22316  ORF Transcript_15835/g.22316 Transcript_15835/m.22316 type:complete len:1259 (-) Transcript_15835:96-3872(-)|eukprot:CAMPEP_0171462916 /NCGR_PEP_ID=MMETSP0945-20130129/6776_1 /TAXON_ID=109269 /ORGANISM="Vaucheria litorea, Strain CCMP2940" /LENGTH=1258 /DNA_ID=CAMNT_0011989565 /DNA_START=148 /DNA_END=3924 /DNA_ORIENTATION=+
MYKLLIGATGIILLTLPIVSADVRGFKSDSPIIPSKDPDLVVESIWQFDTTKVYEAVTKLKFVPGSGRVITAHKTGRIRLYQSIKSDANNYVELINMMPDVHSHADHGLLSFAFHPDYEKGKKYAYVIYTGNPKDVKLLPNNKVVAPLRQWGSNYSGRYEWEKDGCPDLGDNNLDGSVCEKVYYIDRLKVDIDGGNPKMTKDITLFAGACGSSSTHGPGTITLMGGDMIFSMGDGGQYDKFDPGFKNIDACYEPGKGDDQGVFRSVRNDFSHGKVLKIPKALLDSPVPITMKDMTMLSKGNRQPYTMFYHQNKDDLYIGDVGFGDWGTTERIFMAPDASTIKNGQTPYNWGWPCLEGMYSSINNKFNGVGYNPFDSPSEKTRRAYLAEKNLKTCLGVYEAVDAIVKYKAPSYLADPMFRAPIFEYRNEVLDPDYETLCGMSNAAITSVFVYEGDKMPAKYRGKLMFADHVKKCLWYFETDENGNPNTNKRPHVILSNTDIIDMELGPDGAIYLSDYRANRVYRMFEFGTIYDENPKPITPAPTAAPFSIPYPIMKAQTCFDGRFMPELSWQRNDDGSYYSEIVLEAATYETKEGFTRTRTINGMIPAPVIRMKACGTYYLKYFNNLDGWPAGFDGDGAVNSIHDPLKTSLHLHGLHVSGMAPGDDVFGIIDPGDSLQYKYVIPCDHVGGTHFYHPHHHGSVVLNTDAGVAGMLIIESGAHEAKDMPLSIQAMPEQIMVIQEFNPINTIAHADLAKDKLFTTTAVTPYELVNGCEEPQFTLEQGRWTRLRILNVGQEYNSYIEILPSDPNNGKCSMGLLAKDGIWVKEIPRMLGDNRIFVSISSRVDVAVRCPTAGVNHNVRYKHIGETGIESAHTIAIVKVVGSNRGPSPNLDVWKPCRPAYLVDQQGGDAVGESLSMEVRDGLNAYLFTGPEDYFVEVKTNVWYEWKITASEMHPFHVHINPLQFGELAVENQFPEVPNWNQEGDWIDTISVPGAAPMKIRPERFLGKMVMHCHVAQHSDLGIIGVALITGEGDDGDGDGKVYNYGTCNKNIPMSQSYKEQPHAVPGKIEAEEFDKGGEGIAYHNLNFDRNKGSSMRDGEAVEIDLFGAISYVNYIFKGEWMKYTVDVKNAGFYTVALSVATDSVPEGMQWSMWLDAGNGCPAANSPGNLVTVSDPNWDGTGADDAFEEYLVNASFQLPIGKHTLMFCFEAVNAGFNFDYINLDFCGGTAASCGERRKLMNVNKQGEITVSPGGDLI